MMTFLYFFTLALFIFVCLLLCTVILMQESKSSGLGTSFGGEASQSLFGTSTADVLKTFTAWLAFIFLVSCILLSLWTNKLSHYKISPAVFNMEQIEAN